MYRDKGFNDSRYNGFQLSGNIPCARRSVFHTRELGPDPAKPRSFVSPNGILPPLSFRSASESGIIRWPLALLGSPSHRTEPIYSDPEPILSPSRIWFTAPGLTPWLTPEPKLHNPISRFPLFKLSEEAVGQILSHLTGPDLAALALVDKDCRQLARTRQFRSVLINFSSASMALLTVLLAEAQERVRDQHGYGRSRWRLGTCIRRITICCEDPPEKEKKEKEKMAGTSTWVEQKMANNEANELHAQHINALDVVLRVALPNLEFLDWRDRIPITPLIGSAIFGARMTKLELHSVILCKDFALTLDRYRPSESWRLQSLILDLSSFGCDTYNFTASILRLAAPTLEELIWDGSGVRSNDRKHSLGEDPIQFPRLRKVQLRYVKADETVWDALIPTSDNSVLTQLWVDGGSDNLPPFLARRGHIVSLTNLTWVDIWLEELPHLVSFIAANPQLQSFRHEGSLSNPPTEAELPDATPNDPQQQPPPAQVSSFFQTFTTLTVPWATPAVLPAASTPLQCFRDQFPNPTPENLHHPLLSIFASSFHSLTSLAMSWNTVSTIPPAALRSIATITTLQHLCLSAGTLYKEELDWFVDHEILRRCLRQLRQLRWLALTRDAYAHGNIYLYGYQKPREGDRHRDEMLRYAGLFAASQPSLEWMYFGQFPIAVERSGGEVQVVALGAQVNLHSLLDEMWGGYRVNWVYPR